jgi:hypothetical protein
VKFGFAAAAGLIFWLQLPVRHASAQVLERQSPSGFHLVTGSGTGTGTPNPIPCLPYLPDGLGWFTSTPANSCVVMSDQTVGAYWCQGQCIIGSRHSLGSQCITSYSGPTGLNCQNSTTSVPVYQGYAGCNIYFANGYACACADFSQYTWSQVDTTTVPSCSCQTCTSSSSS